MVRARPGEYAESPGEVEINRLMMPIATLSVAPGPYSLGSLRIAHIQETNFVRAAGRKSRAECRCIYARRSAEFPATGTAPVPGAGTRRRMDVAQRVRPRLLRQGQPRTRAPGDPRRRFQPRPQRSAVAVHRPGPRLPVPEQAARAGTRCYPA